MSYGFFDDRNKEYVITRPDTPLPWINYLGSKDFFGIISNTAGGYAFYQDAKSEGRDISWGNFSPLNIYHLSRIPAFSSLDMNVGGHPDALNAIGTTHGPSWRMVVALKDQIEAYGVYPGGQSGNPLSKYYLTSMDEWSEGKYHKLQNPKNPSDLKGKFYTITINKE